MPAAFQIETANWRDLGTIRRLEQICFPKDAWPIWDLVGVLTLPNVVRLKASLGEEIVGFIAADIRSREQLTWIATIAVHPEYRRRGIGKQLLQECEAQLAMPAVRLYVRSSNTAAVALYHSQGYREIGQIPAYYSDREAALVFEKQLWEHPAGGSGL